MLMEQTLHTLKALRLPGMASAFEEQQHHAAMADLSFDERFGLLVDRELTWRENRRLTRLCVKPGSNRRRRVSRISAMAAAADLINR